MESDSEHSWTSGQDHCNGLACGAFKINKKCKSAIARLGANATEEAVRRVGKCLGEIIEVSTNFDERSGVHHDSGHHSTRSDQRDLDKLIQQLVTSKVFDEQAGRRHTSFMNFQKKLIQKIDKDALSDWMREKLQHILTYD